jgi:outer membrane lipoprotein SlyB
MRLPYRPIAALGLLAGLAACASVPPAPVPYAAGEAARTAGGGAGTGVIAAMRQEEFQDLPGGGARARILSVVGGTAAQRDVRAAVEFIVRTDDGQTISVVQGNEDRFRPGERVLLARGGARTRIVRAAATGP